MNNEMHWTRRRWSRIARPAGFALIIAAGSAWAANDLDTPNPRGTTHPDGSNTYNTEWLGHNDLQGRTVYQTTVHTQGHRVIAYAGHFAGTDVESDDRRGGGERHVHRRRDRSAPSGVPEASDRR